MIVQNRDDMGKPMPEMVAGFLNELLRDSADPADKSLNGLQVDSGNPVKRIGYAVDACLEAFEIAKEQGCDMLITHHGLYWAGDEHRIIGLMKNRVSFLIRNNISLWSCHIPLDRDLKFGNNIGLSRIIGLTDPKGFADYHGMPIGLYGNLAETTTVSKISEVLKNNLPEYNPFMWNFGKETIENVGVVSGGGSFAISEAAELGLDLLITGEVSHSDYHIALENKINVLAAGHWSTETVGIGLIANEITDKLGIETVFISIPTRM
ncbi:MAG: Nif3-like dinuclear metal center hexameric protein [Caldisericia bacterium]